MSRRRPEARLRELRIGAGALAFIATLALAAPWLAPFDPARQLDPVAGRLLPPGSERLLIELPYQDRLATRLLESDGTRLRYERLGRIESAPGGSLDTSVAEAHRFWLGTDRFGRDVLSRVLWGARVSLAIGALSLLLAASLGVAIGAAAALGPRWLDAVLMRAVDALLSFPWFFLLIALVAVLPPSPTILIAILGGTGWMSIARLARGEIATLRDREFVLAARGFGVSEPTIFLRHVLPNVATPLLVATSLRMGSMILIEASLSFLGLGIQPPNPSWGNMIADGRTDFGVAWWPVVSPALALSITVLAIHLVGDGLRDALDPRLRNGPAPTPPPPPPGAGLPSGPPSKPVLGSTQ